MAFTVSIRIQGDATADVTRVYQQVADKTAFLLVVGRRAANELKAWFRHLDQSHPNKSGGKRSHFWRQVADSVGQVQIIGSAAVVPINHPVIAHKAGIGPARGVIRAKEKQWLTIPVVPEAYGMSAREFEEESGSKLVFIKRGEQLAFLAIVTINRTEFDDPNDTRKNKSKVQSLQIIFVLKKQVYQAPEPDALPSQDVWKNALDEEARAFLSRTQ